MKQITRSIGVSAVVCLATAAAFAAPAQLLLNTGFEDGTASPDNWTATGAVDWWSGNYYAAVTVSPLTGTRYMINASNWDGDIGLVTQTVTVSPGTHNLALSFNAYTYDAGDTPSMVAAELIVDGEVVASANKTSSTTSSPSYQTVWTTWSGIVPYGQITVRFTLIGDGGGTGWGIAALDDVALYDCATGDCPDQHSVTDVDPNVIYTPAPASSTLAIYGTNLASATGVSLWKTLTGQWGWYMDSPNGISLPGTINGTNPDGSLSVTFPTSNTGDQATGVFDLVVEKTGSNPVVISNAVQIRDPADTPNLLANPGFEVVKETITVGGSPPKDQFSYLGAANVGNPIMWFGEYYKNPIMNPSPLYTEDIAAFYGGGGINPVYSTWSNGKGDPGSSTNTMWQTVPVAPGTPLTFTGWQVVNATPPSTGSVTITLHDGDQLGTQIGLATPTGMTKTDWAQVGTTATAGSSGYVTVKMVVQLNCAGWGVYVGAFADQFSLTATPTVPLRPWIATPTIGFTDQPTITITGGSNLDEVTGVKLVFVDTTADGNEPEIVVPGTIATASPTKLVVRFDMQTYGAVANRYNLVLEKPGAPPANLEYGRIRRFNWDLGTNPGVNTHRYDPNIPATFANVFNYVPPGTELLQNGDFEIDGPQAANATPVRFWTAPSGTPLGYNGNGPTPPGPAPQGSNYGSICDGTAGSRHAYQTLLVPPRHLLTLTGSLGADEIGAAHNHFVRLRDGGPDGPVLAEKALAGTGSGYIPWTTFSIQGTPSKNQVTVEWGRDFISGSGTTGTYVDALSLKHGASQCSATFWADADEDGDVDQADFAFFQACYTGENAYIPTPDTNNCSCFDVTGNGGNPDSKVGQADLAVFESCATGPGVPINYGCGL